MQILSILALLATSVSAVAHWPDAAASPRPWNQGPPDAAEKQCGPAVVALAMGIELNIVGQYGELNSTNRLLALYNSTAPGAPVNTTAFLLDKGKLLSNVMSGISIREYNQKLIPAAIAENPGSAAVVSGYSGTYASAQATELALAKSLTGVRAHDVPVLEMLRQDVLNGIVLNEGNEKNATAGCNVGVAFPVPS